MQWDLSSVKDSLASGTSCLTSVVEQLFGHAAARQIGKAATTITVQHGLQLLTHDSTGNDSQSKPFTWMVFHRWALADVIQMHPESVPRRMAARSEVGSQFVWHVVIHELLQPGAPVKVVTQYFKHNMDVFFDVVREQFAMLDEDDQAFIQTPIRNSDFAAVLRMYFETGDMRDPHTLSKLTLWQEGSLLHKCCEHGFSKCVGILLREYTRDVVNQSIPWLVLADPLWCENGWGNSAFHSAAWKGHWPCPVAVEGG